MRDSLELAAWAVLSAALALVWWQWVLAETPTYTQPDVGRFIAIIAPILVVPLVIGAPSGYRFRPRAHSREVLLLSATLTAATTVALYLQWVSDPRTCTVSPGADCDTALTVSASFSFVVLFVPYLVGALAGRGVAVRRNRLREGPR